MTSSSIHKSNSETISSSNRIGVFVKGAAVSFTGRLVGKMLFALGQFYFARQLGPQLFGVYALGWTLIRLLEVVATLGLNYGVQRFGVAYSLYDSRALQWLWTRAIGLSLIAGTIVGLFLFLFAPFISNQVFDISQLEFFLKAIAVSVPFAAGLRVGAATTMISKRAEFSMLTEGVVQPSVMIVVSIFSFVLYGASIEGIALGIFVSYVLAFVFSLYFTIRLFPLVGDTKSGNHISVRELMRYSLPTVMAGLGGLLIVWSDRLFIGYFLTDTDVGLYQAMAQVSIMFAMIVQSFNSILAPIFAEYYSKKMTTNLGQMFNRASRWSLFLCLPLSLVAILMPSDTIVVLFGETYNTGNIPLIILVVGQIFYSGTASVIPLLMMTGHQDSWLWLNVSALVLSVILNITLIPRFGLVGAALSNTIAISTLHLGGMIFAQRQLEIRLVDSRYIRFAVMAIVVGISLWYLMPFFSNTPVVRLFLAIVVSTMGILIGIFLIGVDREERGFLGYLLHDRFGRRFPK